MMAQTTSTCSDQEGFQEKDGQGGRAALRTMMVPRSSPVKQKGVVLVRDRRAREGGMNFFLSTKTDRAPLRVMP
jgi:hypothetical protein